MNIFRLQMYINFLSKLNAAKLSNLVTLGLSYRVSSIMKHYFAWGKPAFISIEPTNVCNLRCPECPTGILGNNTPRGYIDMNIVRKLGPELHQNIIHVNLFFQGEPFLHQDLVGIAGYLSAKTFVTISTNGHFLDTTMAERIVGSGLQHIIVSLDGYDQQSYATYRRNGSFDQVCGGIRNLAAARKRLGRRNPFIEVQCLLFSHTESHRKDIINLSKSLGADAVTFKTAQFNDTDTVSPLLPSHNNSRYVVTGSKLAIKSRLPNKCWRSWSGLVVTWDGLVLPCCFDKDRKHVLGSLKEGSISQLCLDNKRQGFQKMVLHGRKDIFICKNCSEGLLHSKIK